MNVRLPSKSRVTARGIVLTLIGVFVGIPLLACLGVEYSLSSDLKKQLAEVQRSRAKLRESTRETRELKDQFIKERTNSYWQECHIIDLLDQCRDIRDLPNLQTDFIICKDLVDDPDSGSCWIITPAGHHELQIKMTEFAGKSLTNEHMFAYPLLAKSGYKLQIKVPGPPYVTLTPGVKPDLKPTPIVLSLQSNNPEFKAVEETLPIEFYRRVGTQRFHSNSQLSSLVLRFPGECFGERLRFTGSGMIFLERDFKPTSKTAQLSGFAWQLTSDNRSLPSHSMFISIEVLSDAPACAAPFLSTRPADPAKFQPYSGHGRFFPIDSP